MKIKHIDFFILPICSNLETHHLVYLAPFTVGQLTTRAIIIAFLVIISNASLKQIMKPCSYEI